MFSKVKETILPIFWFEVEAGVTDEIAAQLKPVMFMIESPTLTIIWSCMMGIGGIVVLVFSIKIHRRRTRQI